MKQCEPVIGGGRWACRVCGAGPFRTKQTDPHRIHRRCTPRSGRETKCKHLGEVVGSIGCPTCGGRTITMDVFACAVHGEATLRRVSSKGAPENSCLGCGEYEPTER